MTNAIASSPVQTDVAPSRTQAAQPSAPAGKNSQSKAQPTSIPPAYTVQLSNAAKQALQEATETSAQTSREASQGDMQAKRLLAREAAEKEV